MATTNKELKDKVRSWWNNYPFTYFVKEEIGSWAFFRNVDRKIFKWCPWAHDGYPLFSKFVPYKELVGKKVLDIGCGTGWSTEQFARMGAEVSAIDLTPKAIELTKKRFALYHLQADIRVGDAEQLPFQDGTFDYVFVWGVLMHTPDTEQAIREIYRVLKPGGRAAAMMYNRNSLHFRWFLQFGKGILRGKLLRFSVQELANRYTDGAEIGGNMLTKFYTPA
ncbi:MAG: class I SAM-dependent methyltransferase, partial [bacterium]|nr:class I SAM-dependent methyltransferase [bacterium]